MDFNLTEDQRMVSESVRKFCGETLAPEAAAWDARGQLSPGLFQDLAELGLLGMTTPTNLSGADLDNITALAAIEEIAAADASTALCLVAHDTLVGGVCALGGRNDLRRQLATGQIIGGWPFGVGHAHISGNSPVEATLYRGPTGDLHLRGCQRYVSQCRLASLVVAFARDEHGALALVLVDPQTRSVRVTPSDDPLGCRAADIGTVHFDHVPVAPADLVTFADVSDAQPLVDLLAHAYLSIASALVGLSRAALRDGLAYANERRQFGKPISRFQANQFKLADMATSVDAARLSTLNALSGSNAQKARALDFAARRASEISDHAVQLHGGYGYTREYPVERFLRDANTLASLCFDGLDLALVDLEGGQSADHPL